jgi:hypothetical protein
MNLLELYSKPKCHLCEVARHEILALKQIYGFTFIEIDITQSPQIFEKYREEIPVIMLNGGFISRYKVDTETLENLLKIPR